MTFVFSCIVISDLEEDSNKWQVEISAGSTSVSITIHILDDKMPESDEYFKLTLKPKGGLRLGSPAEMTIHILDDDCEFLAC